MEMEHFLPNFNSTSLSLLLRLLSVLNFNLYSSKSSCWISFMPTLRSLLLSSWYTENLPSLIHTFFLLVSIIFLFPCLSSSLSQSTLILVYIWSFLGYPRVKWTHPPLHPFTLEASQPVEREKRSCQILKLNQDTLSGLISKSHISFFFTWNVDIQKYNVQYTIAKYFE